MCGRFERTMTLEEIAERFDVKLVLPELQPNYNVAPMQQVPAVIMHDGQRELVDFKWGLVPPWAKPKMPAPINAKSETIATSGMFKAAYRRRRCLIPANGFYEWKVEGEGKAAVKTPFHFGLPERKPFAFAGLWEEQKRDNGILRTCTIITTNPNAYVAEVHNRMPVILTPDAEEAWLEETNDLDALDALLVPYPDKMEKYPVSKDVGNVKNNHPELLNSL